MGGASAMLAAMLTRRAWMSRVGVVAVVVFAVGGCIMPRAGVEQITPQGPTAETMFKLRSVYANGREPNFDERQQWDSLIEQKISNYLREHPEKANALNEEAKETKAAPEAEENSENAADTANAATANPSVNSSPAPEKSKVKTTSMPIENKPKTPAKAPAKTGAGDSNDGRPRRIQPN